MPRKRRPKSQVKSQVVVASAGTRPNHESDALQKRRHSETSRRMTEIYTSPLKKRPKTSSSTIRDLVTSTTDEIPQQRNSERKPDCCFPDEPGHLQLTRGQLIADRYQFLQSLGKGTFGHVVKVKDMERNETIALKIVRNVRKYRESARMEIRVLERLARYDPVGKSQCVLPLRSFEYRGHVCIAFEMLGLSVFEFMKSNDYQPYPLSQVRQISYELCKAVRFLHENRITHTDLKPENILFYDSSYDLLYDSRRQKNVRVLKSAEIRLIDFGSATFDYEHHSAIIQTRHYRSPEVVLRLGWSYPCDVWSIGCIMYELALGHILFLTHKDDEHLAMMERILGRFPDKMAKRTRLSCFRKGRLQWNENSSDGRYVSQNCRPVGECIPGKVLSAGGSLRTEWLDLVDLIEKMLIFEPEKRRTLPEALRHSFFAPVKNSYGTTKLSIVETER